VSAHKRPKTTECDLFYKTAMKKDWVVIVGKVRGKPYEIFAVPYDDNIPMFAKKISNANLTKKKSKDYRLEAERNGKTYTVDNIIEMMSHDERNDTRKYSTMLRHRIDPKYIVEQIDGYASIVSFDKVIQRVLKTYVAEDQTQSIKCPQCGGENYHCTEGCWKCMDCGYSKCG